MLFLELTTDEDSDKSSYYKPSVPRVLTRHCASALYMYKIINLTFSELDSSILELGHVH